MQAHKKKAACQLVLTLEPSYCGTRNTRFCVTMRRASHSRWMPLSTAWHAREEGRHEQSVRPMNGLGNREVEAKH